MSNTLSRLLGVILIIAAPSVAAATPLGVIPSGPTSSSVAAPSSAPALVWFVAWGFVATAVVLIASWLRTMTRREIGLMAGITGAATVIRIAGSHEQLMGVRAFARRLPWTAHLQQAEVPLWSLLRDGTSDIAATSTVNLVLSVLCVPLLYCHAAALLGSRRAAALAALLLCINPMVVAFSKSEVMFVASMAACTACLGAFDRFKEAVRPLAAVAWGGGALVSFWASVEARPLSVLLAVVLLIGLVRTGVRSAFRPRNWVIVVAIVGLATYALIQVHVTGQISSAPGAGIRTGQSLLAQTFNDPLTSAWANNYLVPSLTPLWITACIVIGLRVLYVRDRRTFIYLGTWFGVVYAGHFLVPAATPVIAARYGLHSVIPLLLAAAVGAEAIWDRLRRVTHPPPKYVIAGTLGVVVLTTIPAMWLMAPLRDDQNDEYRFLVEQWKHGHPRPGSTVLEPAVGPEGQGPPRYERFGLRVSGSTLRPTIRVSRAVGARADYLYLGLPCLWYRSPERDRHPQCQAAFDGGDWELVGRAEVSGNVHDRLDLRAAADGRQIALYQRRAKRPRR